jgi:hypothetical protein
MESDKENHPPNRPKPGVTQGDAKLSLKINLCHMKRLSELMIENLFTLNEIFSDSKSKVNSESSQPVLWPN